MRKLPLPLALLLLAALGSAPAAQASLQAAVQPVTTFLVDEEGDKAEAAEDEEGEDEPEETGDNCVIEDEEDVQLCAEIVQEEKESREAERCVLESANASVDPSRTGDKIRLTVRYTTYGPAPFSLRYSLRGSKGSLQLGTAKARFGRSGTFHDVIRVDDRKLPKVLAAREFQIELQAQKTPGFCRERLTVQRRGADRAHRS